MDIISLLFPSFIAGLITFLAPCTLPLVPGYLGFISGTTEEELKRVPTQQVRKKIFLNGLFYIFGFSIVFIVLGSLFGLGGSVLIQHRVWLSRIGGVFVLLFGLSMLGIIKIPFLNKDIHIKLPKTIVPGKPLSSFIFGATFGFGWTPCIGPVLGSILFLASNTATLLQGAMLLAVFSFGLGLPFLLIALFIGHTTVVFKKILHYLPGVSRVGGILLVVLGVLLITDHIGIWLSSIYTLFDFIHYDKLLNYL